MWIKTDDDVTTFMSRVREALKDHDDKKAALAVVEHELRHAIRESEPGVLDAVALIRAERK